MYVRKVLGKKYRPVLGLLLLLAGSFASSRTAMADSFMGSHTFNGGVTADLNVLRKCWTTGECTRTSGNEVHPYPEIVGQPLKNGCFAYANKNFVFKNALGAPNAAGYRCAAGMIEIKVGYRTDCPPIPTDPTPLTCAKGGYVSLGCTVRRVPGDPIGDRSLVNFECFGGNRIIVDSTNPGGTAECAAGMEFDPTTQGCKQCSPGPVGGVGGYYKTSAGQGACIPCTSSMTEDSNGMIIRGVDPNYQQCNTKAVQCNTGYEPDPSGIRCRPTPCPAGEYRASSGSCEECPAGKYKAGEGDGPCTDCDPATPLPANVSPGGAILSTWNAARDTELPGSTSAAACNYKVTGCVSMYSPSNPPVGCNYSCTPSVDPADIKSCVYKAAQVCPGTPVNDTGTCGEPCGFGSKVTGCTATCPPDNPATPYPIGVEKYTLVPNSATCAYQITSCSTGYTLTGSGTSAYCAAGPASCTCSLATASLVCAGTKYADSCGNNVCDGTKTVGCSPTSAKACLAKTSTVNGIQTVNLPAANDGEYYTYYSKTSLTGVNACGLAQDCGPSYMCGTTLNTGRPSRPIQVGIVEYRCANGDWLISSPPRDSCACNCSSLEVGSCASLSPADYVSRQLALGGVCLAPYPTGAYADGFCTLTGLKFIQGKGPVSTGGPPPLDGEPRIDPGCFNPTSGP